MAERYFFMLHSNLKPRMFLAVLLSVLLCCGQLVNAAEPVEPVSVVLTLKIVSIDAESGREVLTESESVQPGDKVEYQATYVNNLPNAITNVMATLPIPADMQFLAGSAQPAAVSASLDTETFAPVPLIRSVTAADGSVTTVPVPLAEYRALRWQIERLNPGQAVTVSARALFGGDET
jgi:uncharacterized repeat protein (TIGR01451 family)